MNYGGQWVPIELGQFGIITDLAPSKIPPGALISARNVTLVNGTVQKSPGARAFNSSALSAGIVAIFDWWPNPTLQRTIVATSAGEIYKDLGPGTFAGNGGAPLNDTNLGTLTPQSKFVGGGAEAAGRQKKLFFFSFGEKQVQVLAGDSDEFEDIASPSTDWATYGYPKVGILHRNRMWAFAGQQAYASDPSDHENFLTNDLTIPCFPGEGGDIIGAFVFKTKLFAFKEDNFGYVLNDTDTDSDNWYWQKFVSNFGISAPNAIVEALNDLLMGNSDGTVTSFLATNALGDVAAGDILNVAGAERWIRENTLPVGLEHRHALYYPDKKQVYFTARTGYRTTNDTLLVIDLNKQNEPRLLVDKKGVPQCLALRKDVNRILRPCYGSSDGKVYIMDVEDRLEGATAYTGEFILPPLDFASPRNKQFDFLSVKYVPEGSHDLSCDYYIDGRYIETLTFPMAQNLDPQLGTLTLSTDRLANGNTETSIKQLCGHGRAISFRFYNAGSNQSFQIAEIAVGFMPTGEDAQTATGTEND